MYFRVVSVCLDGDVHVPLRGVLLQVVAESDEDVAILTIRLTSRLWVIHRGNEVFDPQDLADMLIKT